ncbi:MAG: hypothetical protein ACD_13C00144G0019 [uncultured bacterium]|nr:MAG: hypothetical protein ACD_13C00144G0019 [uncultured bacterium]HAU65313.1 hypothetical protein [Candidatus Woesebacteria bacterium]HCC09203.1 hypothetical protein [Candidatus Woesebacteria bacterium]
MIISVIFVLLIILGIGLPLALLIYPKLNHATAIGMSFPLGIGVFTLLMFVTNLVGVRFGLSNELLLLFLISVPLVFLQWRRMGKFFVGSVDAIKNLKLMPVEKVMLGALAFLIVTSFINTFYWPVHIWDSVVLYDFRGHVFAETGFMKEAFIDGYYYNYPLLTSLAHTIVYLGGGRYPQFLYSIFYLSLGVGFYGLLREFVSRKTGIFFTLVLLLAQPLFYHSLISYTNLPFTVYISLGAISIYLWDKKKEVGYLILSALLVGLSTWTRFNEPFWLATLLVVFIVSIYRKKVWNFALYSLFFFPIREVWKVFQNLLRGSGTSITSEFADYGSVLPALLDIEKQRQVASYLHKHVVVPWGAIFVAFILATVSLFILKKQKKLFLIYFITFTLLAVLIAGTIQLSITTDYWYRIGDAAQRLSMLFYPLFIFCIALVLQEFVKIQK